MSSEMVSDSTEGSVFNYIVTAHKATAVTHSFTAAFTAPDALNLVVCNFTSLVIYNCGVDSALEPVFETNIYGRIAKVFKYRPNGCTTDQIFILTESYDFCVLGYDANRHEIKSLANGSVKDSVGRATDGGMKAIVDPECRLVGMLLYDGLFKVVPVSARGEFKHKAFNIRLDELQVLDVQFMDGADVPTIFVLWQNTKKQRFLKTYGINIREKKWEVSTSISASSSSSRIGGTSSDGSENIRLTADASFLVPVPQPIGGVLIFGTESISHYDVESGERVQLSMESKCIGAVGMIDVNGGRFLVSDHEGKLYVLVIKCDDEYGVQNLMLQCLGETCVASSLSYLDNGALFVGSKFGDSLLVRLLNTEDENGSYVEVEDAFPNLGPIVDLCTIDLARHGQSQIVTCSGAFNEGSLRIVRNGIGINEQAKVDLSGIKGLWSLHESSNDVGPTFDKYLVLGFVDETRILGIEDEELSELDVSGFEENEQTLFCGNVVGGNLIQVTTGQIRLISCATGVLINQWSPPVTKKITVASGNTIQILVALNGGELVYLEIDEANKLIKKVKSVQMESDIACIDLSPVPIVAFENDTKVMDIDDEEELEEKVQDKGKGKGKAITNVSDGPDTPLRANLAVVGMWSDATIRVLSLNDLSEQHKEPIGGEVLPRSLLMVSFQGNPYLLVGLADGHLLNFRFDSTSGEVHERKMVSLGRKPVLLRAFQTTEGTTSHVFAATDRPTILHYNSGKLLYSNVNLDEVTEMSPFNARSFPGCLAVATADELQLGTIDQIQKLHVQTIPLGEQPRRISHQPSLRVFLVTTVSKTITKNGLEIQSNHARLLDDRTFDRLDSFEMDPFEDVMCLSHVVLYPGTPGLNKSSSTQGTESSLWASASSSTADKGEEYFVVGTAYNDESEPEPTRGRIIVFAVSDVMGDRQLRVAYQMDVPGGVYTIEKFGGGIAAGVNNLCTVYEWVAPDESRQTKGALKQVCKHPGHILALYLSFAGYTPEGNLQLLVGDVMKSVALLEYAPTRRTIVEVSKDFHPNWMTAVGTLGNGIFVGCENWYNILTMTYQADASTDVERGRLNIVGKFHIGHFVNILKKGSLVMLPPENEKKSGEKSDSFPPRPNMIFGTVSGMIGCIISLSKQDFSFLKRLQDALNVVIKGVGGLKHSDWRSVKHENGGNVSTGFIDGDLIERLLDLPRSKVQTIVKTMNNDCLGSSVRAEELLLRVEALSRLH